MVPGRTQLVQPDPAVTDSSRIYSLHFPFIPLTNPCESLWQGSLLGTRCEVGGTAYTEKKQLLPSQQTRDDKPIEDSFIY